MRQSNDMIIENNNVYNSGSTGISFSGNNTIVRKNLVDTYSINKADCGGIQYGERDAATNMTVTDNIVLNG